MPHQCCVVIESDNLNICLATASKPGFLYAALLANAVLLELLDNLVLGDAEAADGSFLVKRVDDVGVGVEVERENGMLMECYFINYGSLLDAE